MTAKETLLVLLYLLVDKEVRRLQMRIAKAAILPGSGETELYRGLSRVLGNWLARF